jgi:translation initiation factor 2 subunit 1
MLYSKQGMPEEGEIVLCTVTKIHPHSVFIVLDEYGKSGMIHISEISPGRIRNIADYVKQGKKVVCKVLRLDIAKGHIDLSLRRVNEGQRRDKLNQVKKEQRAEKIIDFLSKELKQDMKTLYQQISKNILNEYEYIYQCFEDISADEYDIKKLHLDTKTEKSLLKLIKERMAPSKFTLKGKIEISTYDPNGLEEIKNFFKSIINENVDIKYLGGGNYSLEITSSNHEEAEDIYENIEKAVEEFKGETAISKSD